MNADAQPELSHRDQMRVRHPYQYGFRFVSTPRVIPAQLGVLVGPRWEPTKTERGELVEGAFGGASLAFVPGEPLAMNRRERRMLQSRRYPTRSEPGLIPPVGQ